MHDVLGRLKFFSQGETVHVTLYRDRVVGEDDPNLFKAKIEDQNDSWAGVLRLTKPMEGRLDYRPVEEDSPLMIMTVLANGNPYMTYKGRIFMAIS